MTVHLIITGRVQGVFFRASAKEEADRLLISGWVKNTFDGNVEIVASGNKAMIDQFIAWCRKGPKRAFVTDVIITEKSEMKFENFSILRH